jgi:hypothetical protein
MDKAFIDTVRLLLAVAPEVFRGEVFAMKGGTALNLFVHDMPRLSVDIDVAYPARATPRDETLRSVRSSSGSPDRSPTGRSLPVPMRASCWRFGGACRVSSNSG